MNRGFWDNLPRPFFVMAPMADVTDPAYRQIVAKYSKRPSHGFRGGPDVMFTEFVSSDGLMHMDGRERLLGDLRYTEGERPIVAQLFSSNPDNMRDSARLALELGFDGIDINMGCPDRAIEKQIAGAALIKNPEIAKAVIKAAKEGAATADRSIPVSVKSRLGYNSLEDFEAWTDALIEAKPAVITMHLRTRKEMSKFPAHWDYAKKLVEKLKDTDILAVANGGVTDLEDAIKKAEEYELDGIMMGSAIYGNPWVFAGRKRDDVPVEERVKVMIEHTRLFEKTFTDKWSKSFNTMKKFFKAYIAGHPEAKAFQKELMECTNADEVEKVCNKFV